MNENVIKMARLMAGCKDRTCEDCLSQSKKLFGIEDNKCAFFEYAEVLDKAGYRKQIDTVKEFAERVLKDISDAIDHNTELIEAFGSTNPATYNRALITNNACKGISDAVTAIVKEYGVEE